MGGAAAGEVASAIAVEVIAREVEGGAGLGAAIAAANRSILNAAASGRGRAGMGSTVVAAQVSGRNFTVAWVGDARSEEHTSELQSLMRISYAVFCLKKKNISTV